MNLLRLISCVFLIVVLTNCNKLQDVFFNPLQHNVKRTNDIPLEVTIGTIDQVVDHFNSSNTAIFSQRYVYNDTFWDKSNGPVFLLVGGEFDLDTWWGLLGGELTVFAKEYKALLLLPEHRYFGTSNPTPNLEEQNLQKFLSIEQALADLANFRILMTKKFGTVDSLNRWVAFGCSYSGILSAFFRTSYPQLVIGAIASSAPVQFEADCHQYYDQAALSIKSNYGGSVDCYKAVQSSFDEIDALLGNGSISTMRTLFQLCPDFQSNTDSFFVLSSMFNLLYTNLVQYSKYWIPGYNIESFCSMITDKSNTPLDNFANYIVNLLKLMDVPCLSANWNDFIQQFSDTSIDPTGGSWGRQYLFLTCNEFGSNHACNKSTGCIFSSFETYEKWSKVCYEIFGLTSSHLESEVSKNNGIYGGNVPKGTNIVYTNGDVDPWRALGVTTPIPGQNIEVVTILGGPHCSDTEEPSSTDPDSLAQARKDVMAILTKWLQ